MSERGPRSPVSGGTSLAMRELLFGDVAVWPERDDLTGEPWRSFIEARRALGAGDREKAIARLRGILEQPDLESRQVLQAWHALRLAGESPPEELAKRLEGVVVEVGPAAWISWRPTATSPLATSTSAARRSSGSTRMPRSTRTSRRCSPPGAAWWQSSDLGSDPGLRRRGRARCGSTS
jgi:hypothetical protein